MQINSLRLLFFGKNMDVTTESVLLVLIIISLILFAGLWIIRDINNSAKAYAKAYLKELRRLEKYEKKHLKPRKLWLCPICGRWQTEPTTHLKKAHNVSDDMIQFWIEKGKWI